MSNTVLDELELELEDGHLRAAAKLAYIKKIGGEDARAQGFIPSDVKIPKGITFSTTPSTSSPTSGKTIFSCFGFGWMERDIFLFEVSTDST